MSKFVLNRNYHLVTTKGHSVNFVKDEVTFVPRAIWTEALAVGATPVEETTMVEHTKDQVAAQLAMAEAGPLQAFDRADALEGAFAKLVETNASQDFTASGLPKVSALARVLGWEPDSTERATAWSAWRAKQQG